MSRQQKQTKSGDRCAMLFQSVYLIDATTKYTTGEPTSHLELRDIEPRVATVLWTAACVILHIAHLS